MKIKKGDKIYPVITGDDVIITKGVKHPGRTVDDAFDEVDETLDEHKKKIDRLESNMKYLYSYGGVGGNGRGGSSGGSSTGSPVLFISLDGRQIQSGNDNIIVLNEPGYYTLEGSISNNGGNTFFVDVKYGPKKNREEKFILNADNRWRIEPKSLKLDSNGEISISFSDTEGGISQINQRYIVYPHTFTSKFMYEIDNGSTEFNPYEYFIGNSSQRNPFIDISFKIDILNVTHIQVKYDISGTDGTKNDISFEDVTQENPITWGHGVVSFSNETTNITNNHLKIYLDNLTRNGVKFTDETNNGTYSVSVTLIYTVNGNEQIQTLPVYNITLIPNSLYIYVKNSHNIMYDSMQDLKDAISMGFDGIPEKYVNVGSYTSFSCKIFEGPMVNEPATYYLEFKVYDYDDEKDVFILNDDMTIQKSGVTEQVETDPPFSVAFQSMGIKKIEFSTSGQRNSGTHTVMTKYIFVNEPKHEISEWYPANDFDQVNFYFRAAHEKNIDSEYLSLLPFETSEKNNGPITISGFGSGGLQGKNTTILSFGIQYSSVNKDGAKILEAYGSSSDTPIITLYSNKLFDISSGGEGNKKICIPTESKYNKSVNEQYHLVQIVRHLVGQDGTQNKYASYLYIDGKLESNKTNTDNYLMYVDRIEFNNVNAVYNLIEVQYVNLPISSSLIESNNRDSILTIDEIIYQYHLAYKDIMGAGKVTYDEKKIFDSMSSMKFDGTNVIVDFDFVKSISPYMPIPTMVMQYVPKKNEDGSDDQTDINNMIRDLFRGYPTKSNDFGQKNIALHWCSASNGENSPGTFVEGINPPEMTDGHDNYSASWYVELQGTSTMRNRIKNFSLGLTTTSNTGGNMNMLMSPNYSPDDSSTFLPEMKWTLKADIADSAHANNTSIGRFVNRVCTKFTKSNGLNPDTYGDALPYIKNTLEGFPMLMYFMIGNSVYYLGVYNFNMGRNSYYNLGYNIDTDTVSMINRITQGNDSSPFRYSIGMGSRPSTLAIGEIQDNHPQFDFHQYDNSVLFGKAGMFGTEDDITAAGTDKGNAMLTLSSFVKSVARAGAYCFSNIGKIAVSSKAGSVPGEEVSNDCKKRYAYDEYIDDYGDKRFHEYVPDVSWQYNIDINNQINWYQLDEQNIITFNNVRGNINNLLQCISDREAGEEGEYHSDWNRLDYTSLSEYYTICMAFGLVDSVLKNMNIKSWDGKKCYTAFYDMDCAFGENNLGVEDVTYLAASDYWYSPTDNGYVEPVRIHYDYWEESIGKGFDYPSSYIFAIAKYAQAMVNSTLGISLTRYPQQFWAELRCLDSNSENPAQGELRNADEFIDKYFSSGIGKIPAYLVSLNYQVKYLYYGKVTDENGNESAESRYLANGGAFNGTRIEKVREWLRKRLHFLDFMFNIQAIDISIGSNYLMPLANSITLDNVKLNPDVAILTDAFATYEANGVIVESNSQSVDVWAPMNTPFIINRGTGNRYMFLLNAGTGNANSIRVNSTRSEAIRFYGSKEFTDLSMIEPFLTSYYTITSNSIERIVYGGTNIQPISSGLSIVSSSVKTIKLNIPTYSGKLNISNDGLDGQSLTELDIHDSGFIGEWINLSNLNKLNISSVNNSEGDITIAECPIIGDNCIISGRDSDNLTSLRSLNMSGVEGTFKIENTSIERIKFTATKGKEATFEIHNDQRLKKLELTGFKSVIITGCPNLEELRIEEHQDTSVCETIIIDIPEYKTIDGTEPNGITKFNSTTDINGRFDFSQYNKLNRLGLSGCKNVVVIKMPNHSVEIETFSNNRNLEFIDTTGEDSCIILTKDSTFYKSPLYCMKQSWAVDKNGGDNGKNINPGLDNSIPRDINGGKGYECNKRTKMSIKPSCTSLANTFFKQSSGEVSQYTSNNPYTNEWGQKVYNKGISMLDAVWFINDVVEGKSLDDAYLMDDGTIVDTLKPGRSFGKDCSSNITSLHGCFAQQGSIFYNGSGDATVPNLSNYRNLQDISAMYLNTGVSFISSDLLSLCDDNNDNALEHSLTWNDFVRTEKIYANTFKHISYRISDLNSNYTIYDLNDYKSILPTSESNRFNIVDILCPKKDDNDELIPFERITSFNHFSIHSDMWVDYTHLFEYCPNVTILSGFLNNVDLSRAKIDGLLKPCTKLISVSDSFNHSGNVDTLWGEENLGIDLYEFFNWADVDSENNLFNIRRLFSIENTQGKNIPGFAVKKHISQVNFEKIIKTLHKYTSLEGKLSNIFSYCTITDYTNYEIALEGDMNNISNINNLFYKCKSGNGNPLKIRRSFFEHLPNVTTLVNTFYGVEFDHMLSYDFFCKRREKIDKDIYVKVDGNIPSSPNAILHTYEYIKDQSDLYGCFMNAKFRNCKTWFDIKDGNEELKQPNDIITKSDGTSFEFDVDTYYKFEGGVRVEYKVSEPISYSDTLNNFTNYVESITISSGKTVIDNHNIFGLGGDFEKYGTDVFGKPYIENSFNIYPTYCCLPPDILYACDHTCDLGYVFANTNIIGTLPQHLLGNRVSSKMNDIFMNVNILPNVIYHCDRRLAGNQEYIDILNGNLGDNSYLINSGGIPIDNDTINQSGSDTYPLSGSVSDDAIVLFRDSNGELKRRFPTDNENMNNKTNGDYNKSQFVYVPQGFTKNRYLENAFTFRYNLPNQINLSKMEIIDEIGVNYWGEPGSYDESNNPETYPEKWPYYTQYFLTVDESVSWRDVSTMGGVFISDNRDVDFTTGQVRVLSTSNTDYKNKWWQDYIDLDVNTWHNKTDGLLNVFLNICGERNIRTGIFKDCGALINKSIDARNVPNLDNFVSGVLVVFLNGKIFNENVDGIRFTKQNGSKIINYDIGFSRNIILPRLGQLPSGMDINQIPKVLLYFPSSSDITRFYEFMFPNDTVTLQRYESIYNITNKIFKGRNKYILLE